MNTNESQFPHAKTHLNKMTVSNQESGASATFGRVHSVLHQPGSETISYTGPWNMAGSGKAKDLGTIFGQIKKAAKDL